MQPIFPESKEQDESDGEKIQSRRQKAATKTISVKKAYPFQVSTSPNPLDFAALIASNSSFVSSKSTPPAFRMNHFDPEGITLALRVYSFYSWMYSSHFTCKTASSLKSPTFLPTLSLHSPVILITDTFLDKIRLFSEFDRPKRIL